ncbi:MAG: FumA C-terminus/TtdB family hydratase beta subunit [Methanobacteriaceae archaeon]|nr:FumA C-terminus/TtdB family hydratase beta subunit [Methanobacteriaceae archaeon]MDP2837281.1 FumA C-terminus/TtdB family hydratase beta subunit [Methanobacteriaceae archaeon]MDP3034384.1 FumA C-terminus/TtdB family hydratase beta subunit [Methanobacteriaceae archaeon]MDP3485269.1 FumA C-terminus/TtdB family hydratase beta subunit [Methanobacteriaceae archaeon]MDP3624515.1 FumA C-terminus/TtdB family hydratase beta subunit [Methanobacteriaceae archaeon]
METILDTPLSKEKIDDLKAGDVVYLSGTIFTARDRAHNRIIQEGAPYDLKGSVIFHAGPIIKMDDTLEKSDNDLDMPNAKMIAVGPTTSTRMNPFQSEVIDMGVKAIIGKGGMDENTSNALIRNKAVYLAAVGGCAALYVNTIKKIKNVFWLDLGVPEAIWELEVEKFGPLVVAMDSKGANLYEEIRKNISNSRGNIQNKFNKS